MRLIKILPFLLLLISCTELYKKNAQVSSFNCSKEPYNGIEYGKDSTIFFFPKEIFNDTTWYAKYKDSIIEYTRSYPLEQVIDFYNLNKNFGN